MVYFNYYCSICHHFCRAFVSELLAHGIAATGAAFPITDLIGIRARFCISAGHSQEMLDKTIEAIDHVGRKVMVNYNYKQR
jgi:serine palmitoyltransferase